MPQSPPTKKNDSAIESAIELRIREIQEKMREIEELQGELNGHGS
jgi:hypothetical protein